ncbi:hypothetical protein GCM10009682_02850 [Luedemannella flava]|uniref:Uncharacterized protein n=1 Tax=Luedemannella flava TaxID=349316 RepID=A0ABP4XMW1_9ACTN
MTRTSTRLGAIAATCALATAGLIAVSPSPAFAVVPDNCGPYSGGNVPAGYAVRDLTVLGPLYNGANEPGPVFVIGSSQADTIVGSAFNDAICARGDDDFVDGLGGEDEIYGGNGADVIYGGEDSDFISGGPQGDEIHGDAFNGGGSGNDVIQGGDGYDSGDGDAGVNSCVGVEFRTNC